jgi:hypothetical protein
MRGDVRRDRDDAVFDFRRLVAAELGRFLNGRIEVIEARPDQTSRTFDIDAGIDAICRTRNGIVTLANRVQWLNEVPRQQRWPR